ncbi:HNH endonuclease [Archangium sp.]|uniref:HNH endonuclease n=1 Tax=Archangium sp. TaxID=1872627 RepID=UPI002D4FE3B8|nr:HNH endonuclease [Archangium sp.]HYO55634.1 HNH endonuclease [Archangium sp.]
MTAQARVRNAELQQLESKLGELNKELRLDLLQAGVDAAGTVDPTPVSDLIGAGLSIYRGDFLGAALSLVSMIPYAGDAVGKTAKGAKLLEKINRLRKQIAVLTVEFNKVRKQTREAASAAARARHQAQAAAKGVDDAVCKTCPKQVETDNWIRDNSPSKGWSGPRGRSSWTPDATTEYGKGVLEVQEKLGIKPGTPIQFRDGFPDFSPYAKYSVKIDMKGGAADFTTANNAMKQLDPDWRKKLEPGIDWTWHHHEDGMTMQLVPRKINKVPHQGGSSLAAEPGY